MSLAAGTKPGPYEVIGPLGRVETTRAFVGSPRRLVFRTGIETPSSMVEDFATADGRRFLLRMPAPGSRPPQLELVLGWRALLGQ